MNDGVWQYERRNLIIIRGREDCPINKHAFGACYDCDYTAQIGFCGYPLEMNKEIREGNALPLRHECAAWHCDI